MTSAINGCVIQSYHVSVRHHPLLVVTVLTGILAVFKSYPSIGDAALFLSLVPLHDELFKCKSNYIKGVPVL